MALEWVVLPDFQVPFHDEGFLDELVEYIKWAKPNRGLLHVGDEIDQPQTSRYCKGKAGEFEGTLQEHIDMTREVMARFRAAIPRTREFHVSRSNHTDRLEKYVREYAPAIAGLREVQTEVLLGYDKLGIVYHRQPWEFAPGWMLAHGDEGSLSRIAGRTAANLAAKWGKSVVCGHTHRLGLIPHSVGVNGELTTYWGVEVGHAMDVRKASYLKAGSADWQQGFGLVFRNGDRVTVQAVPREGLGGFR